MPLEIHPETPKEGVTITEKFPAASIERMYTGLRSMGRLYNIDFKGVDLLPNSHTALAAGEFAKEKGVFEEFHERVFKAYFSNGMDIGDKAVVSGIAEESGINAEELFEKLEEGVYEKTLDHVRDLSLQYDIRSTPTFIIDDKYVIVGAQSIENFKQVLNNMGKNKI